MNATDHIYAVTVNHNTSHFVELMLRTLFLTNQLDTFDLSLTIFDNASDDDQLPALRSYLDSQPVSFQQTGFDTAITVEKHGVALQAFVMQHPECTHYLFLDSDMWFIVSSKTINHFTQATYMPERRAPKDRDCLLLLEDLRAGRGMGRANFYESDWVKQQRQSAP